MSRLMVKDRVATSVGVVLVLLVLKRVLGIPRGIVFARLLGPEQYGTYTLGFFLVPIVVVLAGLGTPSTFGRYVPRYIEKKAVRWFIRKVYSLSLGCSVLLAAVVALKPAYFSNLIYGDDKHTTIIIIATLCIPGMLMFRSVVTTFMALRLFRASSLFEFSQVALYTIVGIFLVALFRVAEAAMIALALSFLLGVAFFVPILLRYLRKEEPRYTPLKEPGFYRHLLRFSVWFMVTPILGQLFHYVTRVCVQRLMGSADQGIYSAAENIAAMTAAIGTAVSNVIYPHLSTAWEQGRREEALTRLDFMIRLTAVSLLVLGLILSLLGNVLVETLLGPEYAPAADILPYLIVFYTFTISMWLFGVYPSLIERTYVSTIGLISALPINLLANLVLIPRLGILGAAVATMVSFFVMSVVFVSLCYRYGMPVTLRTIVVSLLPCLMLLPPVFAVASTAVVVLVTYFTPLVLSSEDKAQVHKQILGLLSKIKER
jgi:O-antigen/teichoic acid export membrane protein